jgi:alkyl hydroperoxide reductase subunit AhpC
VGITCDPVPALNAWATQLGGIDFPLCSDFWPHGAVSRAYGVFNEERGHANRAVLLIDSSGVIRYIDVHQRSEVPDEEEVFEVMQAAPSD